MPASTNFAFPIPAQGADPWFNAFTTLIEDIDVKVLTLKPPKAATTLKWGLTDGGHYLQAAFGGTAIEYIGTHDRKGGSFANFGFESQGAIPPAAGAHFLGRSVLNASKLWVCRDATGGSELYTPLTRAVVTVGTAAKAEYATLTAALADPDMTGLGGTVLVMPGTYTVSDLAIPSNVEIVGLGEDVVINYSTAGTYGLVLSDKRNIRLSGLKFVGGAGKNAIRLQGTVDNATEDVVIERCHFSNGVNAIVSDGAFVQSRHRIVDCRFSGTDAVSGSAIAITSKIRDLHIRGCWFDNWGEAGADQRTVSIVGAATSRQVHLSDLSFESNGQLAGVAEDDLYIDNVDDLIISGITSRVAGGIGMVIKDCTRVVVSDCLFFGSKDAGVELDGVVDASLSNIVVDSTLDDGWRTLNACSKVRFVGCSSNSAGAMGFDLDGGSYLEFEGCTARGSGGDDLNVAIAVTNSRFGFVLSKAAAGTFAASNGEKRSYMVPIGGFAGVVGAPAYEDTGDNRAGWKLVNGVEGSIAGQWVVPHAILPGSPIDFRALYAGLVNPAGGNDDVSFEVNVLGIETGAAKLDDIGSVATKFDQAINANAKVIERSAVMQILSAAWGAADRGLAIRVGRKGAETNAYPNDAYLMGLEAEVIETAIQVIA